MTRHTQHNYSISLTLLMGFLLIGLTTAIGLVFGQDVDPDNIHPPVNAFGIPINDSIVVEFTSPPPNQSKFLDPNQFRIHGDLSGTHLLSSNDVRITGNRVHVLNRSYPFKAGEEITIDVNPGIVTNPVSWSFIAEARRGGGIFSEWPCGICENGIMGWKAGDFPGSPELRRLSFADVDGDQWVDVLVLSDDGIFIFKNLSSSSGITLFNSVATLADWEIDGVSPEAMLLEDLDLDGDLDLCFTAHDNYLHVYRNDINQGSGFVQQNSVFTGASHLREIESWNINQDDGPRDVIILAQDQWELLFFENTGNWPNRFTLRSNIPLNQSYATSALIGKWSCEDIEMPEVVLAYRTADAFLSWCNLTPGPSPTISNCQSLQNIELVEPSVLRIAPIYREPYSGFGPEAADLAVYNRYYEEPPLGAIGENDEDLPEQSGVDYKRLYIYDNQCGNSTGYWREVYFNEIQHAILSLAIADFDSTHPTYTDNMGYIAGGPGGFQVIEDNINSKVDRPSEFVVDIATADLDRNGSIDLGVIVRDNYTPGSEDHVYFYWNVSDTSRCSIIDSRFRFPNPVDMCLGCDTLWVPITPPQDYPIIIDTVFVDPPFVLLPLPSFPETLFVGDTLLVGVEFCPDETLNNPVQGYLTVETTVLTCRALITAELEAPQVVIDPDPIDLYTTTGCSTGTTFSIEATNIPVIIDNIIVPSPFGIDTLCQDFPDTIFPGSPKTCNVGFRANSCTNLSRTMQIVYCGGTESVTLNGIVESPQVLQPRSIILGPIPPDSSIQDSFCALNTTGCEQTISLSLSDPTNFRIEGGSTDSVTLLDNGQQCWDIAFTAPGNACDVSTNFATWIYVDFGYPPPGCRDSILVTAPIGCRELQICDWETSQPVESFDFGKVARGESAEHWFSLTNPGMFVTEISSASGLNDPSPFSDEWARPFPITIPPGSNCGDRDPSNRILKVEFNPSETGDYSDILFLNSNAAGSPHNLVLKGESALPNLVFDEFIRTSTDLVRAGKPIEYRFTVRCKVLDFQDSFVVRIKVPGGDSTFFNFGSLPEGGTETREGELTFPVAGYHCANATILPSDPAEENSEENEALLCEDVGRDLSVWPNPFTPNGDGINDELYFDVTSMLLSSPTVKIFSMGGRLVQTLTRVENISEGRAIRWNGRDKSGHDLQPGLYLYVFEDDISGFYRGTIALAR